GGVAGSRFVVFVVIGARLVGHVDHGARYFEVVQRGVAALRGHGADAVDGVLDEVFVALLDVFGPGVLVAEFRRAGDPRAVAGRTGGLEDLFAGLEDLGRVGVDQLEAGHGLDAPRDGFFRLAVGPRTRADGCTDQVDQQDDDRDRDQEGQDDGDQQLT